MSGPLKFFIRSLIFLLIVTGSAGGAFFYFFLHTNGETETSDVIIQRGMSLTQVANTLHKNGIIQYPKLFKHVLSFTQGSSKVRAGEFRFKRGMSLKHALFVLYEGEPIVHQVTIPEGWTLRQIAALLASSQLVEEKKFLDLTLSSNTAKQYQFAAPSLEGYLFPDTYAFSRIDGEEKIIERMVQRFRQKFANEFASEIQSKGWTLERLVTLASIIEKETGSQGERELISSVFHNRLKKKMRLQSDPTTIYGIENFNGNLTKADLQRFTPYNTYTINELPPGAIANPGYDSLVAALRPATTNYLFFVANNQGGHLFSETYSKHAKLVNDYQKSPTARNLGRRAATTISPRK